MKIFLDFDDVIFNTKRLSSDFKNLFFQSGISEDTFKKYYYNEDNSYDPWAQIKKIQAESGKDLSGLEKSISGLVGNLTDYVFDDFWDFSKKIGKENIFILSYGDVNFQTLKIKNSETDRYANMLDIVEGLKSEAIKNALPKIHLAEKEAIYFIDDRVGFLEEVKKEIPQIKTILVKRPDGRYNDECNEYCNFEIKDLQQAGEIILSACS